MIKLQQLGIQVETLNSVESGSCRFDRFFCETFFSGINKMKNLSKNSL